MNICFKYLVLLYCVAFLDAVKFRCDYNYYGVGWFKYNETPMNWNDARLYCRLQGAKLASPTNPDIKAAMENLITKGDVFTGIHSTYSRGQFYSLDGTPLSTIPHTWAGSEPDNKKSAERCIALNPDGDMLDVQCDEPKPFICFRANSTVDVNECGTLDSEYKLDTRTNKCYKLHTKTRDFYQSNFVCSAEGGHLAIINNEIESKVLSEIFGRTNIDQSYLSDTAYVGYQYSDANVEWTTIHDQSLQEAGFDRFAKTNDLYGHQKCGGVTQKGLLTSTKCEYVHMFFCEKKPNLPSICDSAHYYIDLPRRT